jgi:oxygen-independent coproporphyrinogen-3 oxidase
MIKIQKPKLQTPPFPVSSSFGFGHLMFDNHSNPEPQFPDADPPAGLYIHIPFCRRRCPYCDFYSVTDTALLAGFLKALEAEMRLYNDRPLVFDTIYIGGGTPSLLPVADIQRILRAAADTFQVRPDSEITLEVNPGTVSTGKLQCLRAAGIDRLSIGVQSFQQQHLDFLGRIHSTAEASAVLQAAQTVGFDRIGLDLIYGLPEQTVTDWRADLQQAVQFAPDHISTYSLTYEPGTALSRDLAAGRFRPADDETVAALFTEASEYLQDHGFQHYEISNFARDTESRSRHNCKYWTFAPYIGLGPSAHSFVMPHRWWNRSDIRFYVETLANAQPPVEACEEPTREQTMIEAVYLGLRQAEGIDLAAFERRFRIDFKDLAADLLAGYQSRGLLQLSGGRCRLTLHGMLLLDAIAAELVEKIPEI